jgi:hypothetical protein
MQTDGVANTKATGVGVLLGLANVAVIGLGLGLAVSLEGAGGHPLGIAFFVCMIGIVPAVVLGALLGWLAEVTAPLPRWLRAFVLTLPALLLVVLLGAYFAMQQFILVACIPTVVAALVLERATRLVVTPPLPVARARRT